MDDPELNKLFKLLCENSSQQTNEIKTEIKGSIKEVTYEINKLKDQVQELETRCLLLERKSRKNNIVIFGLEVKQNDLVEKTVNTINDLFQINLIQSELNNVYKIGGKDTAPIIVEFKSFLRKSEVFKDPSKLKLLKESSISVANDLCKEDRETQKILRKHMREAIRDGKQARIRGNKLEIEGDIFTVQDISDYDSTGPESETEENEVGMNEEKDMKGTKTARNKREKGSSGGGEGGSKGCRSSKRKRKVLTPSPSLPVKESRFKKNNK